MDADAGVVAVVRVWHEQHSSGPRFRARVTYSDDPRAPARSVVVTEPAEVLAIVEGWLTGQVSRLGQPP